MKNISLLLLVLVFELNICFAHDSIQHPKPSFFIEPQFMIGRITPNYNNFPAHSNPVAFSVSLGKIDYSSDKEWTNYFNYPSVGVMFSYVRPGNDSVFGQEFSIMPYFEINPSKGILKRLHLKAGLGCSYFTKFYNLKTNPGNSEIGSRFNWAFQSNLDYVFFENKKIIFLAGLGYMHSSNGHTQLPNFGMNSFVASISSKFFLNAQNENLKRIENKSSEKSTNNYFFEIRNGLGIQEYGPAGGLLFSTPKKPVYAFSLAGGIILGRCFKLLTGFTYRYYQEQYDSITYKKIPGLVDHPVLSSSNLLFYVGFEMLFGYISSDIETGVNLYKPFFKSYYQRYAFTTTTVYKLKSLFPTRLGLKLYLFNTNKLPLNNFYLGANINANYTQADFSELSIGFVRILK
jgi:hypothetical protein